MVDSTQSNPPSSSLARSLTEMNAYQSNELVLAMAKALQQGLLPHDTLQQALSQVGYSLPTSLISKSDTDRA